MKILVVGKGGREHALIRALAESPGEHELFSFPGSDAIAELAEIVEVEGDVRSWLPGCRRSASNSVSPAKKAIWSRMRGWPMSAPRPAVPCWGPHKESAQLEASKEFAKDFLKKHQIPTGGAEAVATIEEAREAIGGNYPVVLKFDGLAAGKGVAVCMKESEGEEFLQEVLVEKRFGEGRLLVEEYLTGPEVSIFAAVVDGGYQIFTPARDYKRIGEGDEGPIPEAWEQLPSRPADLAGTARADRAGDRQSHGPWLGEGWPAVSGVPLLRPDADA